MSKSSPLDHERDAKGDKSIFLATGVGPYPSKADKISDRAANDPGHNFGRPVRYGIMKEYVGEMKQTALRGVPVNAWLVFFHRHESTAEAEDVDNSATR